MSLIIARSDTCPEIVRKEAHTFEERERLRRESQVLAAARHPGVVEVLAVQPDRDRPDVIVMRAVEGGRLADNGDLGPAEVAALGAAVATILADLHDIGVVHGRVATAHVLLEPDGRPVLCGFGHGRCRGQPDGPSPADDVAALATLLTSQLSAGATDRLSRVLTRAGHPRPARRPTARRLARTLGDLASDRPRPRPRPSPSPRRGQIVAAGAAACLTLGIGLIRSNPPSVTQGRLVVTSTGRYRVGVPGDQVVVGRWRCPGGPNGTPAVLRPSTGEVWAFDGWVQPAAVLGPRLVAIVPGARALRVAAAASGCDRLVVLRSSGPPVTVSAG
jgi:tRNA A-37 threonylcarbamoyl transferase component Bud32